VQYRQIWLRARKPTLLMSKTIGTHPLPGIILPKIEGLLLRLSFQIKSFLLFLHTIANRLGYHILLRAHSLKATPWRIQIVKLKFRRRLENPRNAPGFSYIMLFTRFRIAEIMVLRKSTAIGPFFKPVSYRIQYKGFLLVFLWLSLCCKKPQTFCDFISTFNKPHFP